MSDTIISVENLSKRYLIRQQGVNGDGLRHQVEEALRHPLKRLKQQPGNREEFWALKDVSFDIKRGAIVGVIGRNGAGKSTLLKILSRITEPTTGRITIDGRVASLLEVGTGFHQELTGRENIFLNGSILGMKRSEIQERFDQIVDFSGVEKFIDTQVKHYSSGMRVRLAFSVAAHLKPDILFIDEVLAVGDLEFQQKCLAKMKEITSGGRTVILVSHNLAAIKEMCNKCILLDNGELKYMGPVSEGLTMYCMSLADEDADETQGGGWLNISVDGENVESGISTDLPVFINARLDLAENFINGALYFNIKDSAGNMILLEKVIVSQLMSTRLMTGRYNVRIELPALWLAQGVYMMRFRFHGQSEAGDQKRFGSPRTLLNISGSFRGRDHTKTLLHPRVRWNLSARSSAATLTTKVQEA